VETLKHSIRRTEENLAAFPSKDDRCYEIERSFLGNLPRLRSLVRIRPVLMASKG
jgi:hypothetical protein